MFTGIVEELGEIVSLIKEGTNVHLEVTSKISKELKIDQSIAHNGVCLTVVKQEEDNHIVTAISETLQLTNLSKLKIGDQVNLERCMKLDSRLDGHIVQGHVDTTGLCTSISEEDGSWRFRFRHDPQFASLVLPKGSVCVNGTSLTVVAPDRDSFEVAIIPYTYENTIFHSLKEGDIVNLEFDILGKYLERRWNLGLFDSQK